MMSWMFYATETKLKDLKVVTWVDPDQYKMTEKIYPSIQDQLDEIYHKGIDE